MIASRPQPEIPTPADSSPSDRPDAPAPQPTGTSRWAAARPVLTVLTSETKGWPAAFDRLRDEAELRVVEAQDLGDALPGTDVLLMWDFFSEALADVFDRADRLGWIHAASAGVDTLMFPALRNSQVTLTNARGTFDRPIAEFVLSFVLLLAKDMPRSWDDQRARVWQHRETEDVAGTTAMIVGVGAIGRETARLLRAVGMRVVGAGSRARDGDPDFDTIVDSAELARHVGDVDWLVNIAPLTRATENLLDAEVFAALPNHARVVNVGRGASLDTSALIAALESGSIAGAGLDVVDTEPLPEDHPLWSAPNLVLTPHMSGDTHGWMQRLADGFLANWDRYLAGETLQNRIDLTTGYSAEGPKTAARPTTAEGRA
ncbi:D-2-hydroxyacid dehydrogenase [Brevibacterium samyangense]|uniref:D-2-hydroxyacid dehydrogenase n=1 Tax=Brevibacterium samyangense TaxID=366888 RepID=A0ABP5EVT7_9MICO